MSGLHIAYVEVVIGEDRTPNWTDEYRSILNAEFVNGAGSILWVTPCPHPGQKWV